MFSVATFKSFIPRPVKRVARRLVLDPFDQWQRDRALIQIVADMRSSGVDRHRLKALRQAWGNEGFSADVAYLEVVADYCSRTAAPVFECGSGVTTLVAGVTARGGVWSVEPHASWAHHVQERVASCRLTNIHVLHVPMVDEWYDLRSSTLPSHFGVVLCDGPRGTGPDPYVARGYVAARLPATWDHLLADDAAQSGVALDLWRQQYRCNVELRETPDGAYAIVTPPRSTT